jgi:hypothetical protein
MPAPTTYDKYPPEFYRLLEAVREKGEVEIPHASPYSLRGRLQAFLRAVEKGHPDASWRKDAGDLMVRMVPGGVVMCSRSRSPDAQAIAKVLAGLGLGEGSGEQAVPVPEPSEDFLRRFGFSGGTAPSGGLSPAMIVATPEEKK